MAYRRAMDMSKLVAVFSYGGNTRTAAELIAGKEGAKLFEIRAKVPYSAEDINWRHETSRNVKEQKDSESRPEIEALPDLQGVEEIWIGYPI